MKIKLTSRKRNAFTLVEMLAVIFVIAVLIVLFLPALATSGYGSNRSKRISCVNNLKQTGLAFRIWAGDNDDKFPMEISATNDEAMRLITGGNAYVLWQMMSNELSTPKILYCPADADHVTATSFSSGFSDANISYFFGLDVTTNDTQRLLLGDDNLAVNDVSVRTGILTLWTNFPVAWTAARHKFVGNIGLADGSVQQLTTGGLVSAISNAAAPSRIVIP
jgi:prepilin-type N-terminal cleavage/methylation domain-containing protein